MARRAALGRTLFEGATAGRAAMAALAFLMVSTNVTYAASLNQNLDMLQATAAPLPLEVPHAPAQPTPVNAVGKAKSLPKGLQPTAESTTASVNKLLAPRVFDPTVPLPGEDVAHAGPSDGPVQHTRLYGHPDVGGALLGLRIPIPADRGVFDNHTRSSVASTPSE